jgi:hypothetical protein
MRANLIEIACCGKSADAGDPGTVGRGPVAAPTYREVKAERFALRNRDLLGIILPLPLNYRK